MLVTGGVAAGLRGSWRGRIKRALGLPMDNLDALPARRQRAGSDDRVHVTGFRRDVAACWRPPTCSAFPSLEPEGFGRPIIEAMAMACPVVATDIGPSRELLGADAGRSCRPTPHSLADGAWRPARARPPSARRMGRAGRARVEACFTLDRQVAAMSAVYREAASGVLDAPSALDFVLLYAPPWSGPTRFSKHHLASYLASRGGRVLYVEAPLSPLGLRRGRALRRRAARDAAPAAQVGRAAVGAALLRARPVPRRLAG